MLPKKLEVEEPDESESWRSERHDGRALPLPLPPLLLPAP